MERNEFDSTKDDSDRFSMESVLNIIVTIPLGFGLSFLMRCSWRQIMLSGLLVGGCAEAGQLLTALWVGFTFRHVNIDDILLNIIGVLLGYGVFKIFRNVFQWGYKKLETNSNAFCPILNVCAMTILMHC